MFGFPVVFPLTKTSVSRKGKRDNNFRSHRQSGRFPVSDLMRSSVSCFYHAYWSKIHPAPCWNRLWPSKMSRPPVCGHEDSDERSREGFLGIEEQSSGVPTTKEHFLSHFQRFFMLVNLAMLPQRRAFQLSRATATEENVNGFNGLEMSNSAAGC